MEKKSEGLPVVTTISKKEASAGGKKSFWHINKRMLPFKMHFFFFIGGMGATLPFQSAFAITRLGLTASNLAAAYTAQQVLFILLKPGIGYLADYFNKLKATIIGLTVIQAIFFFFMIMIPKVDVQGMTHSYESNKSFNKPLSCLLCDLQHDFKSVPAVGSIEEERVLRTCLEHSERYENLEVQCFQRSNFPAPDLNVHLSYGTCNNTMPSDFSLSKNASAPSDGPSNNILIINRSFDGTQISSLVCISPQRISFTEIYDDIFSRQNCRAVTGNASSPEKFRGPETEVEKCGSSTPLDQASQISALSSANFKTYQFWLFALFLIGSCTCISCVFTMSDTACYESVQGEDYGRQRAWGAISWGLIAPFAGFLNDYTDSYMASWCVMVVLCSLQIWNMTRMDLVKPDFSESILKDLKKVFSSVEFLAFEAGVFMNGMFTGVVWFYLTWFLNSIGGNKLVIGLAHTVQCYTGEVPIMFISGWMIKKLGHFNIVSLALITHGIRFYAYSYIHNPWWILPLESLHGFTFGSFYSAMTSYGKLNSKPGTEATTQSVLCTTYEALGAGLGCVIAGICFDQYGGSRTFYYASYLCAIATLINVIATALIKCRKGVLNVTKPTSNERY